MMVTTNGSIFNLLWWQAGNVRVFTIAATIGVMLYYEVEVLREWYPWVPSLDIPYWPLAVVGGAIGIFVSFRTNSAYDRWWEGRKLWGRLINTSRMFVSQTVSYVRPHDQALGDLMVRRQVAYVHMLRVLLRKQDPWSDADLLKHLTPAEKEVLPRESNPTHAMLQAHLDDAMRAFRDGHIDNLQLRSFDESIKHLLDIQGGCERIKKTPLPRGYGFIAEQLILYFSLLLPLGLAASAGVLAIPLSVLACLSFVLINEAGRVLEDPFNMFYNGLPLSAISVTLERNLLQRIGETDLPDALVPNDHGILM